MMKSVILYVGLLFCIPPIALYAAPCHILHDELNADEHEESTIRSMVARYTSSVIPGSVVGVTSGTLCAILEHMIPQAWPLFWLSSFVQREQLVHDISSNMKKRNVPHYKKIMWLSSLMTTWISYYLVYKDIHGRPPF